MGVVTRVSACVLAALALFQTPTAFAARTSATDNFSAPAASRTPFGTRGIFNDNLAPFVQWTNMLARTETERAAPKICAPHETVACTPQEWAQLLDQMRDKTLRQKLEIANAAMNRHPYVPTQKNWNRAMYWESPFQFLRVGGQCQDYAIAKYELLRQAGVPADLLQMVVLHASTIGADHAVLVAYVDGDALLLDNLRSAIVSTEEISDYHPYYAINETGWWRLIDGQAMQTRIAYGAR